MRVIYHCPQCGRPVTDVNLDSAEEARREFECADHPCPVCQPAPYGPITRELLAEALYQADEAGPDLGDLELKHVIDLYGREADFILRLLRAVEPHADLYPCDTREWLFGLARPS